MFKKITMLGIIAVIAVSLTGCQKTAKLENGEDALVTFTDETKNISVNTLYNTLKDEYGIDTIIEMIDTIILEEKYETTTAETESISSQISQMREYYSNDEQAFLSYIQEYGFKNVEELEKALSLNFKRNLAIEDYVKGTIKDSEIEDYYNEKVVGDITASHILIAPKTGTSYTDEETAAAKEEALKTANEIITKLNNGEDFAELAKEYSTDTGSAADGGALGKFNRGKMVQAFEDAAIKLEVGKYSTTPVLTEHGYHIILKTAQDEKSPLKEVKDYIIEELMEEKLQEESTLQYKALVELRKSYGVTINDEDLNYSYETAVAGY